MVNVTCEDLREYRDYVSGSKFATDAAKVVTTDLPWLASQLATWGWETSKKTSSWLAVELEKVRVEVVAWAIHTERLKEEDADRFGGTENRHENEPESWKANAESIDAVVDQLGNLSATAHGLVVKAAEAGVPVAAGAVERISKLVGLGCMYEEGEEGWEREPREGAAPRERGWGRAARDEQNGEQDGEQDDEQDGEAQDDEQTEMMEEALSSYDKTVGFPDMQMYVHQPRPPLATLLRATPGAQLLALEQNSSDVSGGVSGDGTGDGTSDAMSDADPILAPSHLSPRAPSPALSPPALPPFEAHGRGSAGGVTAAAVSLSIILTAALCVIARVWKRRRVANSWRFALEHHDKAESRRAAFQRGPHKRQVSGESSTSSNCHMQ